MSQKTRSKVQIEDLEHSVCCVSDMAALAVSYAEGVMHFGAPILNCVTLSRRQADHIMSSLLHLQEMVEEIRSLYYEAFEGQQSAKASDEQPPTAPH